MFKPLIWKMLNKEHTILAPISKEPWRGFTFKEIKHISKNSSDNYVHTVLKRFVASRVLNEKKIGNSIVYSMANNTFALNTIGYIAEYIANTTLKLPNSTIQKIIEKIKNHFYVFIITGSYVKGTQKKNSDLDIVIICDNRQKPSAILSQIALEAELAIPEVHPYVFTQQQFYQMLTTKEENYGKEIARNCLIITGGKAYFSILMEAIEHGFTG